MARSRMSLRPAALLAALLTLLAACGGGGGGGAQVDAVGPDVALEATPAFLASVADRSEEAGFRYELMMSMELDMGFEAMSIAPDEPFAYGAQESAERLSMTMDMGVFFEAMADELGDLGGDAMADQLPDGDQLRVDLVVDGDQMWMRAPMFSALAELDPSISADPTLAPLVTMGDQWGRIDLAELGDVFPAGDIAQVAGAQSMSPADMLALLDGVAAVEELGSQEIRGVETTGLRATTTFGDLLAAQGQSLEDLTGQMGLGVDPITAREMEQAMSALTDVPAVLTVWVDGAGMLRRFEADIDLGALFDELATQMGEPMPFEMSFSFGYVMDLFDYGSDITVDVPDVANPVDLTALLGAMVNGSTFS